MKKKNLLMYALASLLLAGCSENLPDGGDGGGVLNPDGESWVSLDIRTASQSTKALHDPEIDPGTSDESNVKAVKAIFFDKDGKVTVSKDLTTGPGGEAQPGQSTGTPGKPFKVPNTSTKVLVIVNPVGIPAITAGTTSYDEVNEAVTGTVGTFGAVGNNIIGTDKKAFMMTNAAGKLEPYIDGTNLTLHETEADALKAPFVLNVDRVSSKVRLYMQDDYGKAEKTYIQEIGWVLNVTNKQYYPVSERMKTEKNTPTPFDSYGLGSYRKDPNFTNNAGLDYDVNYNYYTGQGPADGDWNQPGGVEYCLENTQDAVDNVHAYTTHVIFKAKFTPMSFANPGDEEPLTITEEQAKDLSWIKVGGGYYTFETLMNWIEHEMTSFYGNTGYTPSITIAFNDFIENYGVERIDTTSTTGTAAEKAAVVRGKFETQETLIKALAGKMFGTVSYYDSGVSYYKIMIKHDNDNDPDFLNQLGEFGVVRNSVYDLTITGISNPGYPVIPPPDPGTKDEDNDGWISIQININPWTWYSQPVEL